MTNLEGRVLRRRAARRPPDGVRTDLEIISELATRLGRPRGFPTPDGHARFHPVGQPSAVEEVCAEYPYHFTTGRVLAQYQSGAQTRRIAALKTEPYVEPHPAYNRILLSNLLSGAADEATTLRPPPRGQRLRLRLGVRATGIDRDRRVVQVDDGLRTSDPDIFAIGDCADCPGAAPGLVAPAWAQASVVADLLTGADPYARFRPVATITRLKAAGIDLAAMGESTEAGWNLYVGGNGGFRPVHAQLLAKDMTRDELIRRTAAWIEAMEGGLEHLRSVIIEDSLGICSELDAAMAGHVGVYTDEWRAALADPQRLARFVSFVNAPDTPDPTIAFTSERGQPIPLVTGGLR